MADHTPTKSGSPTTPWSRRPHFAARQLLTAHQLNAAHEDELERQRLLNKALHGYGVVNGFGLPINGHGTVAVEDGCIDLSPGVGLDRHGRILNWDGGLVAVGDVVGELPDCEGHYTLRAHYAERLYPPEECGYCDKDHAVWREQAVVFSLSLGCEHIDRSCVDHPDDVCLSHDDYLCLRTGGARGPNHWPIGQSPDLAYLTDNPEPGPLLKTVNGEWCYDPDPEVAIPLACIEVCDRTKKNEHKSEYEPDCEPIWEFCGSGRDWCEVRPLVYRSPLLYELINCCDVETARVANVSWYSAHQPWSSALRFGAFRRRIMSNDNTDPEAGFAIRFSKRVDFSTVHPGSVFLTVVYQERRSDYWMTQRIPMKVLPIDYQRGEGAEYGTAIGCRLVPDHEWIEAEVATKRSTIFDGFRLELTVRGQIIRDTCGHMIDARPLDVSDDARCADRAGGDFVFAVQVAPRRRGRPKDEGYDDDGLEVGSAAVDDYGPPAEFDPETGIEIEAESVGDAEDPADPDAQSEAE
jgi:hypothetical protein